MAVAMDNLENEVHLYQENHSPKVLNNIVNQLDGLILSVVHKMLNQYHGRVDLEFDDLYQVGIIGLIRALASLPDEFDLDEIRMRVVAYVRAEIKKQFVAFKHHSDSKSSILYSDMSVSDEPMYLRVEVKELFNLLIQESVISREDFYFLYHRFVDEVPVRDLAKWYGKTLHGVIMWEQRLLKILRHDLRVRGFENANI